jgi:hypothetical protein
MKGKLVTKAGQMTPNGREAKIEVRRGVKGKGAQVGSTVLFWPWSAKSEEKAYDIAYAIAERFGIEIVPDSGWND